MTEECVKKNCMFCVVDDDGNAMRCSMGLKEDQWNPATCINPLCRTYFPAEQHESDRPDTDPHDAVNSPSHYVGKIGVIDYLLDKLTPAKFTGFCIGNVLKYTSRWRKKDGVQDLKKAKVYLEWAIENEDKKQD